ncbi:acetate/propionate family kinase [Limibacillus sp. MBR-115]|jgi:acetate kinase|uniref:acetate/propionate family kinase n=1 Tax=Limibacillus sp. MBR-115 TaxID=3156465 RepID=UPI00339840AF
MAGQANRETPVADVDSILVINCGSSSVKFALFADDRDLPRRLWSGAVERIGLAQGRFMAHDPDGTLLFEETHSIANHVEALDLLISKVEQFQPEIRLQAVGHRVVHGGDDCDCPLLVTAALEARLQKLIPLAPLHQPHNLAGILAIRLRRPDLPQVAVFDTAFHQGLPRLARMTGLPRSFEEEGIRRYGFHGLSYEYVLENLRQHHDDQTAEGRIIIAHLGNGASMAALRGGRSLETTMGFSTLGGLTMGTRTGDLDPGILLYLLLEKGRTAEELQEVFYSQSGLLGISGLSRNMQDLLACADSEQAAEEAVDFFCYQARKYLAGLTASLGGLDHLVFTGGIGANAPEIRTRICDGLGYLGIMLDESRNLQGDRRISLEGRSVVVEAIPTDEELMIAHHVTSVLDQQLSARRA